MRAVLSMPLLKVNAYGSVRSLVIGTLGPGGVVILEPPQPTLNVTSEILAILTKLFMNPPWKRNAIDRHDIPFSAASILPRKATGCAHRRSGTQESNGFPVPLEDQRRHQLR